LLGLLPLPPGGHYRRDETRERTRAEVNSTVKEKGKVRIRFGQWGEGR